MFDIPIDLKLLEDEVVALEQQPIEKDKILFYGHSIFTRWGGAQWGFRRLDEDIRMKDGSPAAVNHGFGTVRNSLKRRRMWGRSAKSVQISLMRIRSI